MMANLEDRLTTGDLRIVRFAMLKAATRWYDIGLELGMSPETLDSIKEANKAPEDCLRESLKIWLSGEDPNTNWKSICSCSS